MGRAEVFTLRMQAENAGELRKQASHHEVQMERLRHTLEDERHRFRSALDEYELQINALRAKSEHGEQEAEAASAEAGVQACKLQKEIRELHAQRERELQRASEARDAALKELKESMEKQIANQRADHDIRESDLESQLSEAKRHIAGLMEELCAQKVVAEGLANTTVLDLQRAKEEIAGLKPQLETVEASLSAERAMGLEKLQAAHNSVASAQQEFNENLKSVLKNHESAMQALQAQHDAEKATLQAELDRAKVLVEEASARGGEMEVRRLEEMERFEQQAEQERKLRDLAHKAELDAKTAQLTQSLEMAEESHRRKQEQLSLENVKLLKLSKDLDQEMEALRAQLKEALDARLQESADIRALMDRRVAAATKAGEESLASMREEIQQKMEVKIAREREAADSKLKDLNREIDNQRHHFEMQMEQREQQLKSRLEAASGKVEASLRAQLEDTRREMERAVQKMHEKEEALNSSRDYVSQIQADLGKRMKDRETKLQADIAAAQKSAETWHKRHDEVVCKLKNLGLKVPGMEGYKVTMWETKSDMMIMKLFRALLEEKLLEEEVQRGFRKKEFDPVQAFNKLDVNGSGMLNQHDFSTSCKVMFNVDNETLAHLFNLLDNGRLRTKGDGQVRESDFLTIFTDPRMAGTREQAMGGRWSPASPRKRLQAGSDVGCSLTDITVSDTHNSALDIDAQALLETRHGSPGSRRSPKGTHGLGGVKFSPRPALRSPMSPYRR